MEVIPSTEPRSELLSWLNASLPDSIPRIRKVEDCGRGVPYVVLLPYLLPSEYHRLTSDPRVKTGAKFDFEAATNFKVVAEVLQRHNISKPFVLDDPGKLIKGHFQSNLALLQWFKGFADGVMKAREKDGASEEEGEGSRHTRALNLSSTTRLAPEANRRTKSLQNSTESSKTARPSPSSSMVLSHPAEATPPAAATASTSRAAPGERAARASEACALSSSGSLLVKATSTAKKRPPRTKKEEPAPPSASTKASLSSLNQEAPPPVSSTTAVPKRAVSKSVPSSRSTRLSAASKTQTSPVAAAPTPSETSPAPAAGASSAARPSSSSVIPPPLTLPRGEAATNAATRSRLTPRRVAPGAAGSGKKASIPTAAMGRDSMDTRPSTQQDTTPRGGGLGLVSPAPKSPYPSVQRNIQASDAQQRPESRTKPGAPIPLRMSPSVNFADEELLEATLECTAAERQFYYDKLRMIERLVVNVAAKDLRGADVAAVALARSIRDVLYATN